MRPKEIPSVTVVLGTVAREVATVVSKKGQGYQNGTLSYCATFFYPGLVQRINTKHVFLNRLYKSKRLFLVGLSSLGHFYLKKNIMIMMPNSLAP